MNVETFDEFKARMNCEMLAIKGRYCFRNGAVSDGMFGHSNPPADEFSRLTLQRAFLQFKYDKQVKLFNEIKQENLEASSMFLKYSNSPPPNPDAPDALRRIRETVLKLREEIQAIDGRLTVQPENAYVRRQAELRQERLSEALAVQTKIQEIVLE